MSRPIEEFSAACAASCGRPWEQYHKQCNLVFCLQCLPKHTCSPEPDRSRFYKAPRVKKGRKDEAKK